MAIGITLSLVVHLGMLHLAKAYDAYDVALLKSLSETTYRLRTDDASKKQENESNNLSNRHV